MQVDYYSGLVHYTQDGQLSVIITSRRVLGSTYHLCIIPGTKCDERTIRPVQSSSDSSDASGAFGSDPIC
jgi:hypothetical protein